MDWKENVRKYWWVGAILLALLFILRPRQQQQTTVSRMAAVEGKAPTSDGLMEQTLARLAGEEGARASRMGAAHEALALQQMEMQKRLMGAQSAYQLSILRGQTVVQERLADKASKVKFACRRGKAKLDPETGRLFCREEETKGMSIGGRTIFGPGGLFEEAAKIYASMYGVPPGGGQGGGYGGGYGSTPPFNPDAYYYPPSGGTW